MRRLFLNNVVVLISASLSLSACGGDGGTVGSAPPPIVAPSPSPTPTPTPTYNEPATTSGNYGTIAVVLDTVDQTARISDEGDISIAIDRASNSYTLTVNQPVVPITAPVFQPVAPQDFPNIPQNGFATVLASGDRVRNNLWLFLNNSSTGPHYVSLAEWSYDLRNAAPDDTVRAGSVAYFVFGDRTPPGVIPASGTATYTQQLLDAGCDCFGTIRLSADFLARTMAANLGISDVVYSIQASGTGAISALGDFSFGLSGTATSSVFGESQVSGSLVGALFGPQAQETGGVFNLRLAGIQNIPGAFTAKRE